MATKAKKAPPKKKFPTKKPAAKRSFAKKKPSARKAERPARAKPSAPVRALRPARGGAAKKPARKDGAPAAVAQAPAAPVPAATGADESRPTALLIAHAGLDKKAEDVTVLDVRGLTSYADYFVVMTADSDRQAGAIADHVEQTMKAKGLQKVGVEGYEGGRWILVDYGDVVAHVMNKESRGFYDLEGLWADAPRITVEG
jgi:ribosome-associated protein